MTERPPPAHSACQAQGLNRFSQERPDQTPAWGSLALSPRLPLRPSPHSGTARTVAAPMPAAAPRQRGLSGFTLLEVLVALGLVAVALLAGMQASQALARSAERQGARVLAQVCAQNALAQIRLARQLPDVGRSETPCRQAAREFTLRLQVQPTPNPSFRRVDAQLLLQGEHVLALSTVVGRY